GHKRESFKNRAPVPPSSDDALKQARALAERGETQQARQLYQLLLEKNPADTEAQNGLAALERRSAQFQALSEVYQKGDMAAVVAQGDSLARQYPQAAFLHNLLGNAHAASGRWQIAAEFYLTAVRLRPGIAEAHVNLGKAFSQLGRHGEAISCFRNATRIKPGYADAHYSSGVALHLLKRDTEAIAAYRQAIAIRPDFAEAYDNQGIALRDLGRFDEAAACFRHELTLRPKHAAAYVHLGIALRKVGHLPESNEALAAALEIQPNLADTLGQKLFQDAIMCDWATLAAAAERIATLGLEGPAVRPFVMLA